jgi:hypothetical protein
VGVDVSGLAASEEAGEVDAVAADVHERAAAEGFVEADVFGAGGAVAEAGADGAQGPDLAALDGFDDGVGDRMGAVHEGFDHHALVLSCDVEYLLSLREVHGERVFSQRTCLPLSGPDGPLVMEIVGETVVDRLHALVGEQRFVGAVDAIDAPWLREAASGIQRAGADGDDLGAALRGRRGSHAVGELPGDVPRS